MQQHGCNSVSSTFPPKTFPQISSDLCRLPTSTGALSGSFAHHSLLKLSFKNSLYSVLESALEPVSKKQKQTKNLPTTQTWFCLLQVSFVSWNCKRFIKQELVCLKQNFSREVSCH